MTTLVPHSSLDLQFVLSQTPEFHGYFEGWQDAHDTFERLVHLVSQTDFGADLIPLMSVARLRHTRHACSVDPYVFIPITTDKYDSMPNLIDEFIGFGKSEAVLHRAALVMSVSRETVVRSLLSQLGSNTTIGK
jgi:hypothetical protein